MFKELHHIASWFNATHSIYGKNNVSLDVSQQYVANINSFCNVDFAPQHGGIAHEIVEYIGL